MKKYILFSLLVVALSFTTVLQAQEGSLKTLWTVVISAIDLQAGDLAGADTNTQESIKFKIDPKCTVSYKAEDAPLSMVKVGDTVVVMYLSGSDGVNTAKKIMYKFDPSAAQ